MTLWVVKIGTSLLRGETAATIDGYARCFAGAMARGDQVVLVTSGAVGLGCQSWPSPADLRRWWPCRPLQPSARAR